MMDWTLFLALIGAVFSVIDFVLLVFLDKIYPRLVEIDDEVGPDTDTQQSTTENNKYSGRKVMLSRRARRFTDKSQGWIDAHNAESRR